MNNPTQMGRCATCDHSPISYRMAACPMCGSRLPWAGGGSPVQAVTAPAEINHSWTPKTDRPAAAPDGEAQKGNSTDAWFYASNSNRLGPVSENQLQSLVRQGTISRETPVWRNGMGNWVPAGQTPLSGYFASSQQPPALMGQDVSNTIVWILAFVPVIHLFFATFMAGFTGSKVGSFWWTALIANIVLCLWDEQVLKKAGHDTNNMGWLAVLLVPGYLFVRASRLRQSNAYAWVWVVCFIVSLVGGAASDSNTEKAQYQTMILNNYNEKLSNENSGVSCSAVTLEDSGGGAFDGTITCSDNLPRKASIRPNGDNTVVWRVTPGW